MKLWEKTNTEFNKQIQSFTVGKDRELDLVLAKHDVRGSLAHIKMLESINLLSKEELDILTKGLQTIHQEIVDGEFKIQEDVEDIHSQVELVLTTRFGDIGKKIHSGRSRNDQILLDLKLFIREELQEIVDLIIQLINTLIDLSERYKGVLMPGYTHYQVAMPSSFGLWFGCYAESLVDDLQMILSAFKITNKNPLGSAAGYGSSFPLNRKMTTELLGFDDLNWNVVYAQMGRGKTEKCVSDSLSSVATTLSKISQDICLYINQNFDFISFPSHLTTGSSIMPHKKNPDVFELIRAKSNKIISLSNQISLITTNLSSGYHRDLQVIKESFIPTFMEIKECLSISKYSLEQIIIRDNIIGDKKYDYLFSVEEVNRLVVSGVSFRDAYKIVGDMIENGDFKPNYQINHTHEGSIGNLCNDQILRMSEEIYSQFGFERIQQ